MATPLPPSSPSPRFYVQRQYDQETGEPKIQLRDTGFGYWTFNISAEEAMAMRDELDKHINSLIDEHAEWKIWRERNRGNGR